MSAPRKVFIYHPSTYLGGSEVLFSRIALILKDVADCELTVISDSEGSAVKKALGDRSKDFDFMDFREREFYAQLGGSLVIASARNIIRFYSEQPLSHRCVKFRTVFWALHPAELYAQVGIGYDRVKKIFGYNGVRFFYKINPIGISFKRILDRLIGSGSLFFMDKSVLKESEWVMNYEIKNPKFLHVFSGLESSEIYPRMKEKPLKPILLSRLDSFKLPSVYKLIDDYNVLAKNGTWSGELTIVGDGKAMQEVQSYAESACYNIKFSGHVPIEKLREFLIEGEFDIFFGMGMSLLEGASIGLPCVVIPASERRIDLVECYALLSCGSDSLGEYIESPVRHLPYQSLDAIISAVGLEWGAHSKSSIAFFEKYYSKEVTTSALLKLLDLDSVSESISIPRIFSSLSFWRKFNRV